MNDWHVVVWFLCLFVFIELLCVFASVGQPASDCWVLADGLDAYSLALLFLSQWEMLERVLQSQHCVYQFFYV